MNKMQQALLVLMDHGFTRIADRISRARDADSKLLAARSGFYELCRDASAYPLRRAQYLAAINALNAALVELEGEAR